MQKDLNYILSFCTQPLKLLRLLALFNFFFIFKDSKNINSSFKGEKKFTVDKSNNMK